MSELKVYIAPTADGTGLADYYLKSEADKVIASKDYKRKKLIENVMQLIAELRHNKYKRCLAMAKWCEIGAQFQHNNVMQFDNPFYIKRAEWLEKWHKRWLEIAEKFKEEK